jgi:hypothetical protein
MNPYSDNIQMRIPSFLAGTKTRRTGAIALSLVDCMTIQRSDAQWTDEEQ